MDKEKGVLSVEATIVLTTLIFFIMLILSFGRIFQAQNYMAHGLLETGKALAFKSYEYEKVKNNVLANIVRQLLSEKEANDGSVRRRWNGKSPSMAAERTFQYVVMDSDKYLKYYGISDINFSKSKIDNKDLVLHVSYNVKLPFGFFGHENITMHQQMRAGLWSR